MADNKKARNRSNPIKNVARRVKKFFKDLSTELKKVTWPTKKEVVQNTGSVLLLPACGRLDLDCGFSA